MRGPVALAKGFIWLSDKYAMILTLLAPEAPIRGLSIPDGWRES